MISKLANRGIASNHGKSRSKDLEQWACHKSKTVGHYTNSAKLTPEIKRYDGIPGPTKLEMNECAFNFMC